MAPLTDLLKLTTEWTWGPAQRSAFQQLKEGLCQTATLAYPDTKKPFIVHLDASNIAMGATLSQTDEQGQVRLLCCASRKFNSAEKNYPTHEREMMALIFALTHWKHYLMGAHTVAYTDSSFLKFLTTLKDPSPRVVRWMATLSLYHCEIHHIPGSTNTAADALSRMYPEASLSMLEVDLSDWASAY